MSHVPILPWYHVVMTAPRLSETNQFKRPSPRFGADLEEGSIEDATPRATANTSRRDVESDSSQVDGLSGCGPEPFISDDPYEAYPLWVDAIRSRLFKLGLSKSKDSIQRYCREGTLKCVKLGMLRRYYATDASVARLCA